MSQTTQSLSSYDRPALESWAASKSLPPFRGKQLFEALARRAVQDLDEITEFPLGLRRRLKEEQSLRSIVPRVHLASPRDGSQKVLFGLHDGPTVETVLIPSGGKNVRRNTVCVSSQVGCPAGCTFCATGLGGFVRNLTAAEISDQVFYFAHWLQGKGERVTNIVYMGMGEPLLNVPAVRQSITTLSNPDGFNFGARRVTVSTVGIVPQIRKFAEWAGQANLAVSLHAPEDDLRSSLVPYNAHFPIQDILSAVRHYISMSGRRVSFEYVLLHGVNDSPSLAVSLATLLHPIGRLAHVNVIPWNPFREGRFVRSEGPDADAFVGALQRHGVRATVRYSKGLDISAACGQLREQISPQIEKASGA